MVKVQGRLLRIELTTSKTPLNKISILKGLKRRAVLHWFFEEKLYENF
jgi:hypothetical protein